VIAFRLAIIDLAVFSPPCRLPFRIFLLCAFPPDLNVRSLDTPDVSRFFAPSRHPFLHKLSPRLLPGRLLTFSESFLRHFFASPFSFRTFFIVFCAPLLSYREQANSLASPLGRTPPASISHSASGESVSFSFVYQLHLRKPLRPLYHSYTTFLCRPRILFLI